MKRSLIPILLVAASTQAFAQAASVLPTISVPEPSTFSLLVAGVIALGLARRRVAK